MASLDHWLKAHNPERYGTSGRIVTVFARERGAKSSPVPVQVGSCLDMDELCSSFEVYDSENTGETVGPHGTQYFEKLGGKSGPIEETLTGGYVDWFDHNGKFVFKSWWWD